MTDEEGLLSPLAIRLLGPFDARIHGRPLPRLRSRKEPWLLALLVLHRGRAVDREWLAGALWPESPGERALFYLRRSLSNLRHALGTEACRLEAPTSRTLRLDLVGVDADVLSFDEAVARGDGPSLEQAVGLHHGALLPDCLEDWVIPEREAREQAYLAALETLAERATARGDALTAVHHLRRLIAADPLRDSAHRALMQALAATGDAPAAAQLYRDFRARLHHELNVAPDAETTALYQRIRGRTADSARERESERATERRNEVRTASPDPSLAPSLSRALALSRLPRPLTCLIGREQDVPAIRARLEGARLVTLTGAGGIGKTRLAIQVADEGSGEFVDGVAFVDLSALTDPALVPRTVATALDVREHSGGPPAVVLQEYLAPLRFLLVLDNCEHLVEACAGLAEALLSAAPQLRVLTTSRQPLGVAGEIVWPVPPLSLPTLGREGEKGSRGVGERREGADGLLRGSPSPLLPFSPSVVERLMASSAVRLFVERAAAANPAFGLTEGNAAASAQVCCRLEGMPLAIELAAARARALSVHEIAARLDDCFRLLNNGSRTAPARQQTLQAALDWSYSLLSEPERALLRRLAIFAGSFTLEAAEAVCACGASVKSEVLSVKAEASQVRGSTLNTKHSTLPLAEGDVLDVLTSLVDKSLVQVVTPVTDGESGLVGSRYRLLETTRTYARRRLADAGEAENARTRHRDWCMALAERARVSLRGPGQIPWIKRLDTEYDNVRAALEGCETEQEDDLEAAMRIASALVRYWQLHGGIPEGRARLMRLLDRSTAAKGGPLFEAARVRALYGVGTFDLAFAKHESAQAFLEASLAAARRLGDREQEASALLALGLLHSHREAYHEAEARYCESLAIAREIGYQHGIAMALNNLGTVASMLGDRAAARRYYEEALALQRALEDPWAIALAAGNLAGALGEAGEHEAAKQYLLESLSIERAMGGKSGTLTLLSQLACNALARGDQSEAEARFQEYRDLARDPAKPAEEAYWVSRLGQVCYVNGYPAIGRPFMEEGLAICSDASALTAGTLRYLGHVARAEGRAAEARAFYARALEMYRPSGIVHVQVAIVEELAGLDAHGAWPERAARLFGAAEAVRQAQALSKRADHSKECAPGLAAARLALGEAQFESAWAVGLQMTLEEAIELALSPEGAC